MQDYQLRFSDNQPLANGNSTFIVQPTRVADAGKSGQMLAIEAAISGTTGTATGAMTITLQTGEQEDGSDMAPAVTWYVPAEKVTSGGIVLVGHVPPGLKPYQRLVYAGVAGVSGGVISAGYSMHGGETAAF